MITVSKSQFTLRIDPVFNNSTYTTNNPLRRVILILASPRPSPKERELIDDGLRLPV
jgi:hypothetical protein